MKKKKKKLQSWNQEARRKEDDQQPNHSSCQASTNTLDDGSRSRIKIKPNDQSS
jgi:hypothetical protein